MVAKTLSVELTRSIERNAFKLIRSKLIYHDDRATDFTSDRERCLHL